MALDPSAIYTHLFRTITADSQPFEVSSTRSSIGCGLKRTNKDGLISGHLVV